MGQTGSKDKRGMPVPQLAVPPGYAYPPGNSAQGQGQGQGFIQAQFAPSFVPQQAYVYPPGFVPSYAPVPMPMPVGFQQPVMPMQMQMPQPQVAMPQQQQQSHQPQHSTQQPGIHQPVKGIMRNTKKTTSHHAGPRPVIPPAPVIPNPPPSQAAATSGPVMPTTAASPHMPPNMRRTQTPGPFRAGVSGPDNDDDDDDDDRPPTAHRPPRRTPTRASRPPRTRRTQSVNVPRPSSAQQSLSRGASLSLSTPIRAPPAPPRDVFLDPENRDVLERLNRPLEPTQLTRSLTLSAIPAQPVQAEPPPPEPEPEPPKKRGSLLRAFSRKPSAKPPPRQPRVPASAPPDIYIYPVQPASGPNSAATTAPPNSAVTMPILEGQPGTLPVPSLPNSAPPTSGGQARGPAMALLFNENTEHAGFLNHSPHRIFYDGVSYPSALHLAEAMKFLPHRRDVAEQIRSAQDIAEAYAIAGQHSDAQDPTWSSRYLEIMEDVLFHKFSQNADLRQLLSDTGDARLVYNDPDDAYWSNAGGKGQNCLGVLLERVRDRLRRQ